ncbi:hypothetical protein L596_019495 [Steinernema carpocapsae]|uniref:Cytoplasmic tRNA 2-thiolation protein 2 n=1 Tax=Steinernema carpocapsae TaxID=34508 RepID=A0A4U5MQQ2_STECR|nr:hypothetical protein L596_019495 [Steinernema carpocapsae]
MAAESGTSQPHRSCVKCPEPGIYHGLDAKKAVYCKPCFITMVKHKFSSSIGKKRIFKGDASKETLVIYEGNLSSGFMLWLIQQGLALDAHKKLQLQPIVLVLLTQSTLKEIQEYVDQVAEVRNILKTDWYFVHLSSLLEDQFQPSTSAPSLAMLEKWNHLCASFKTNTARVEFERLSRTAACLRTAKALNINKVMFADDADALSNDSLNALCLGRGSSLGDIAGIIDKRHPSATIIRPLRDVSRLEISTVNEMHGNGYLVLKKTESAAPKRAVQPLSEGLIMDLQKNGFKSTITTILSVASKVHALHPGDQKCSICFTLYPLEDEETNDYGCCRACNTVLRESRDTQTLETLFHVLRTC